MRLIVSRRATHRIREISGYIHDRNPSAALQVAQALRDAFNLLATHPDAGRRVTSGVRRFSLTRYPYLIYYSVHGRSEAVTIITVIHAARVKKP